MKEIKERPILFSSPMVKALLEGKKIMARRVVNTKKEVPLDLCPYGRLGSKLCVREAFTNSNMPDGPLDKDCSIFYRADYFDDPHGLDGEKSQEGKYRNWKPSMFLPRWASRIDLEITNVKIERQDISEEDSKKEGVIELDYDYSKYTFDEDLLPRSTAKAAFESFWDSINAKNGQGWYTNPWVWAIEFN